MRDQHGQGTVEYLAVVLLVAGVVGAAAALLVATGIGEQVVAAFQRALCIVTGGRCDDVTSACVRSSRRHTDGGMLEAGFVHIGHRAIEMHESYADGTAGVTLIADTEEGLVAGTGAEAHVRWGSYTKAYGRELRYAILAGQTSGRTWVRPSDAAATRAAEQAQLAALSHYPKSTIGGYDNRPPMRPETHAAAADITFSEHSVGGDLVLVSGDRRYSAHLAAKRAYGERIDHRTQRRTIYVRNLGAAQGRVSVAGYSLAGSGQVEERYGVTFDRAGRALDLMVLSAIDVAGTAGLPPELTRVAGLLSVPLHGKVHLETEQHLDLTDPANAAVAGAFLGTEPDAGSVALTAGLLRDRLEAEGSVSVRTYRTQGTAHQVGGHASVADVGLGFEAGSEDQSAQLVDAVARGPHGEWRADPACLPV
jgi:hypothetical protein